MTKRTIFLSGPMRGMDRSIALAWRTAIEKKLKAQFIVLHAYRGREEKETFPDPKGAVIRDKQDILRCDLMIVNDSFEHVSMIGTSMEVFFAWEHNKPIIIFGNAHPKDYWLNYHSHIRVDTLKEACSIALHLFSL